MDLEGKNPSHIVFQREGDVVTVQAFHDYGVSICSLPVLAVLKFANHIKSKIEVKEE